MTHTITAQDGTEDSFSPVAIVGFAPSVDSGNIIERLIAPGQIAVTLVGDYPRAGDLDLRFSSDADAEAAREILGRRCLFSLVSTSREVVNMTFARAGSMTPAMNSAIPGQWEFRVGYQEVIV